MSFLTATSHRTRHREIYEYLTDTLPQYRYFYANPKAFTTDFVNIWKNGLLGRYIIGTVVIDPRTNEVSTYFRLFVRAKIRKLIRDTVNACPVGYPHTTQSP